MALVRSRGSEQKAKGVNSMHPSLRQRSAASSWINLVRVRVRVRVKG